MLTYLLNKTCKGNMGPHRKLPQNPVHGGRESWSKWNLESQVLQRNSASICQHVPAVFFHTLKIDWLIDISYFQTTSPLDSWIVYGLRQDRGVGSTSHEGIYPPPLALVTLSRWPLTGRKRAFTGDFPALYIHMSKLSMPSHNMPTCKYIFSVLIIAAEKGRVRVCWNL